jgi:predicted ATPase
LGGPVFARLAAVSRQRLAGHATPDHRYRFVHALVRETLCEDLSLAERVQCHREIGEIIERLHAAHLDPYFAMLADHFEKAVPNGEAEKALRYQLKAGEAAMVLFAYEEAIVHYERARQLVPLVSPDDLQHCRLLLQLGDAQQRAGATTEARETYLQAAALARRVGAHTGHAEAARALAHAALGIGGQGDLATRSDRVMADILDEALQLITAEDTTLRVRLLSRLAIALYFLHAPERREALSQEAVALARRLGDPATLAEALAARYYALWGPDHVEERLAIARETLRLGDVTESKDMMRAGYIFRALALLEVGDVVALDENLLLYTELITELRQPSGRRPRRI